MTTRRDTGGRRRRRAHPLVNNVSGRRSPSLTADQSNWIQKMVAQSLLESESYFVRSSPLVCSPFIKDFKTKPIFCPRYTPERGPAPHSSFKKDQKDQQGLRKKLGKVPIRIFTPDGPPPPPLRDEIGGRPEEADPADAEGELLLPDGDTVLLNASCTGFIHESNFITF